jgi:hypothetical protein
VLVQRRRRACEGELQDSHIAQESPAHDVYSQTLRGWFVPISEMPPPFLAEGAELTFGAFLVATWRRPASYGVPAVPGDAEDNERDDETNDRIGDRGAERDDACTGKDAE